MQLLIGALRRLSSHTNERFSITAINLIVDRDIVRCRLIYDPGIEANLLFRLDEHNGHLVMSGVRKTEHSASLEARACLFLNRTAHNPLSRIVGRARVLINPMSPDAPRLQLVYTWAMELIESLRTNELVLDAILLTHIRRFKKDMDLIAAGLSDELARPLQ